MLKAIGRVVGEVRKLRGLNPKDLAADAQVAFENLSNLEAGKPGASTAELARIAEVLGLELAALLVGKRIDRPSFSAYLRHNGPKQDFSSDDTSTLEDGVAQGRALLTLSELLGETPGLFAAGRFRPRAAPHERAARAGYQRARDVRAALELPTEPLPDLRLLFEQRFGVAVICRNVTTSRATAFGVKAGRAAAIVLPSATSSRVRGYLAHELSHILFDPDVGGVHVTVDVERGAHRPTVAAEQRANGFSAELLLPLAGLTELLGSPAMVTGHDQAIHFVARARDHFGASWQMAANHLCNLQFIHADQRGWLEAIDGPPIAATYVARHRTTLPTLGQASLMVSGLTRRAHERGMITDAEARSFLGIAHGAALGWDESE